MGLEDINPNHKLLSFASISTVQRYLSSQQYHFFDTTNFQLKQFNSISPLNDSALDLNTKTKPVGGRIKTKEMFI